MSYTPPGIRIPTSIELVPDPGTVYEDSYLQLEVFGNYDTDPTHEAVNRQHIIFTSSDTDVADVTINRGISGRVYGDSPGTSTITGSWLWTDDGPPDDTAAITVLAAPELTVPTARFSLAFGSTTLNPYPEWTAIDTHPNLVTSYSISRGRSYELDQTDTGSATVQIMDADGILDPANPTGPYYGQLDVLLGALLCRHNPVTDEWEERFRGYVTDFTYTVDPSQKVNQLSLELTDSFELLSGIEMQPGVFGNPVNGQCEFDGHHQPAIRIRQILRDAGFPGYLFAAMPADTTLQKTVYSAGESPLTAVQDAANGDFPYVSNLFVDRHGRILFHSRRARFDPDGTAPDSPEWDYHHWNIGDGAAIEASPTDTAQVRALTFSWGTSKIINQATAIPAGAKDSAIGAGLVTHETSLLRYGPRHWSELNLLTLHGDINNDHPTGAITETHRFAEYYILNYGLPQRRINQITFRSMHPADPRAPANWDLLSRVDIGDTVNVTVETPGAGFSSEQYFVEGVSEDVQPLDPDYDDVTITLDLSPRTYFDNNPWDTPLDADDDDANQVDDNKAPKQRKPRRHTSSSPYHAGDHVFTGPDPFHMHYDKVGLPAGGAGDGVAIVHVEYNGDLLPDEPILNFTGGYITATSDPANSRTNILGPDLSSTIEFDEDASGGFLDVTTTTDAGSTFRGGGNIVSAGAGGNGVGVIMGTADTGGGRTGLSIYFPSAYAGDMAVDIVIAGTHFEINATGVFIGGIQVATVDML